MIVNRGNGLWPNQRIVDREDVGHLKNKTLSLCKLSRNSPQCYSNKGYTK